MRHPIITRSAGLGSVTARTNVVTVPTGPTVSSVSSTMPFLVGHFARFNEWTEIANSTEGHFLERVAPGSFTRSIAADRSRMRITFQHGHDPYIGDKPLAPIELLGEDSIGGHYGGRLFDTQYNRDLVPALRAGQFGSSFRFRVVRESYVSRPERAAHNPDGLPERTILEADVFEFGPVTFPAYAGATADARLNPGVPRVTSKALAASLATPLVPAESDWWEPRPETAADREKRRRWLDSVMPLPGGRLQ
jgi:HK97 family phage prohead protease